MIELQNIQKRFDDAVILNNINVRIDEGTVTALVGPSGGGKSTLLRCINLLEIPTSGTLTLGNHTLDFSPNRKPAWSEIQAIRRQTGMVFQNFQLFPHQTAIQNVMEGLITVLKWPQEKAREHAMELLTKVGMAHKADVWPSTLSGGQQQRIAIARALAPSPRVLLCDEPTSALDPELATEVVDVLSKLAKEGTTMVIATHDLRLAAKIAQNVVFLESGNIVETGTARDVFVRPEHNRTKQFVATINAAHSYDI
ncbi:amino acid ABC transporter ATP-binding protein [Falsochrobactrum ovis]|uniref:Amino acid ABC transporter ATP-binding protein (PAAT family) n=1 Tax=Falsochrobactrum ovis TaxID=1293442 RepID=A0A364JT78_9HYPH|nr:amino acid ABC transporter ATP-binding protein [Falsochrobactrum ovis]RAK26825.1 amino acid ABC transporter ATP-binding protein (PAAT family) [Falsochrobactrum ovis]